MHILGRRVARMECIDFALTEYRIAELCSRTYLDTKSSLISIFGFLHLR